MPISDFVLSVQRQRYPFLNGVSSGGSVILVLSQLILACNESAITCNSALWRLK